MTIKTVVNGRRYVKTSQEIAEEIGTVRSTVYEMRKIPGNPGKTRNGYDVDAWKEFREKVIEEATAHRTLPKETREKLGQIRIRREKALAEKEELLLEKLKNQLAEIVEVKSQWRTFWVYAMNLLHNMLLQNPKLTTAEAEQFFKDFMDTVIEYQTEFCKVNDHAEGESKI